jgi:hypothetical protein
MPAVKGGGGSSDFIVRLEGVPISDEARHRIAGEIQSLVMREVARLDTGGDLHARLPWRDWYGLWLRKELFREIQALQVGVR